LNRVEGLAGIACDDEGLTVGAMTRQWDLEHSSETRARCFDGSGTPPREPGAPSAGPWPMPTRQRSYRSWPSPSTPR
jgi:hypothetical protein